MRAPRCGSTTSRAWRCVISTGFSSVAITLRVMVALTRSVRATLLREQYGAGALLGARLPIGVYEIVGAAAVVEHDVRNPPGTHDRLGKHRAGVGRCTLL